MSAPGKAGRWLMVAATLVVVAAVTAAIVVTGGPSAQRELRLDERRVADLARLARMVREYHGRHGALPPDLATLERQPGRRLPRDPGSDAPYAYETVGAREFRLCAGFSTDTAQSPEGGEMRGDEDWSHPAGRSCFVRKAERRP